MFKIYNTSAITRKQRFQNALVAGLAAGILCVAAFFVFYSITRIYFSLLYVLMGFVIGYAIQRFGKGVQIQFAILAVCLTLIVITVCDLLVFHSFYGIISLFSVPGTASLWQIGYRLAALYLAYENSRIIS